MAIEMPPNGGESAKPPGKPAGEAGRGQEGGDPAMSEMDVEDGEFKPAAGATSSVYKHSEEKTEVRTGATGFDIIKWLIEGTRWQVPALVVVVIALGMIMIVGYFGMTSVIKTSQLSGSFTQGMKDFFETSSKAIKATEEASEKLRVANERLAASGKATNDLRELAEAQRRVMSTLNGMADVVSLIDTPKLAAERLEYYRTIDKLALAYPPTIPGGQWSPTMMAEYVKAAFIMYRQAKTEAEWVPALAEYKRRDDLYAAFFPGQEWRILYTRASAAHQFWKTEKDLALKAAARQRALDGYSTVVSESIDPSHRLVSLNNYAWLIHDDYIQSKTNTIKYPVFNKNDLKDAWLHINNAIQMVKDQPQLTKALGKKLVANTVYDTAETICNDLAETDSSQKAAWMNSAAEFKAIKEKLILP